MKKIVKIFFIIYIFILLISNYSEIIKAPLVSFMPITLFQIQSGSMMPNIKIGEIVIVSKSQKYKENDIITYKTNNNYFITHRIIKVTETGFITKGDFNNTEDEKIVKLEEIKGKVIFHSIILGKVFQYRCYIILILIFIIYISKLINKKRRKNANKNKKAKKNKKK